MENHLLMRDCNRDRIHFPGDSDQSAHPIVLQQKSPAWTQCVQNTMKSLYGLPNSGHRSPIEDRKRHSASFDSTNAECLSGQAMVNPVTANCDDVMAEKKSERSQAAIQVWCISSFQSG
jgi:hypothetical protein